MIKFYWKFDIQNTSFDDNGLNVSHMTKSTIDSVENADHPFPRRSLVQSSAWPIFFQRIDDSHFDRIHSSLTAVHCFHNGYVGKQPVAWKEYCAEYWLKDCQESMDRCTGRRNKTEILLKMPFNTLQSINHPFRQSLNSLLNYKILDWSKFKAFADAKINVTKN